MGRKCNFIDCVFTFKLFLKKDFICWGCLSRKRFFEPKKCGQSTFFLFSFPQNQGPYSHSFLSVFYQFYFGFKKREKKEGFQKRKKRGMGRRGIVSLFCLSIFIFLSLSHTKKLSEIQVGGRFGSFRKKGFLGYGVISDDLWLLGENPPLFSSGDVYDGVVNATKGSKISYFSGQFLAAKDDDYQVDNLFLFFLSERKKRNTSSLFKH